MLKFISPKQQRFLQSALLDFEAAQLITPEQAAQMRDFYEVREATFSGNVFLWGLGAALLLLGVGQLVAHHWNETSPTLRLALAALLLLAGASALWRWRGRFEALGLVVHVMTLGLAQVIIAQVFQWQGTLSEFMLQWGILFVPAWWWSQSALASHVGQGLLAVAWLSDLLEYHHAMNHLLLITTLLAVGFAVYQRHVRITLMPLIFLALGASGERWLVGDDVMPEGDWWLFLLHLSALLYPLAKHFGLGLMERFYGAVAIVWLSGFALFGVQLSLVVWQAIALALLLGASIYGLRFDLLRFSFALTPALFLLAKWLLPQAILMVFITIWSLVLLALLGLSALMVKQRALASFCFTGFVVVVLVRMFNAPLLENAVIFALAGVLIALCQPKRFDGVKYE